MSTIKAFYSDNYIRQEMGIITGSFTIQQLPDKPCRLLRFKAHPGNNASNRVRLGVASNICPYELTANDDTDWIASDNMNHYYLQTVTGTATLIYWLMV